MKINVVNKSENLLPKYAKTGDAGMDICASEDVAIAAFDWETIPTGLFLEAPPI